MNHQNIQKRFRNRPGMLLCRSCCFTKFGAVSLAFPHNRSFTLVRSHNRNCFQTVFRSEKFESSSCVRGWDATPQGFHKLKLWKHCGEGPLKRLEMICPNQIYRVLKKKVVLHDFNWFDTTTHGFRVSRLSMLAGMKLVSLLSFLILGHQVDNFVLLLRQRKCLRQGIFLELQKKRLILTNYELQGTQIVMNGL